MGSQIETTEPFIETIASIKLIKDLEKNGIRVDLIDMVDIVLIT